MSDKFSRFLNLERERAQGPTGGSNAGSGGRFDALEGPGAAPAQNAAGAAVDRFRQPARPATAGASGLELVEKRAGDQPFVRCALCEADNNLHASSCFNCGGDFNTAAQRAFNERLWQQRREEAAREAEELERFKKEKEAADAMLSAQQRQAAVMMASQVAAKTRARLDAEELNDRFVGYGAAGMWARGRASRMMAPNLKAGLIIAAIALLLVLLAIPKTRPFVLLGGAALVSIYLRSWWWRR